MGSGVCSILPAGTQTQTRPKSTTSSTARMTIDTCPDYISRSRTMIPFRVSM
ncbi:hypothetical protein EMPG_12837 [Blastomyces silverae]|uniref:Uncharacterized protein n=1 Tax=Blastomyces silverae TaxID=2060906 RepID=A0A0H1BLT8_9EURO|nr:hypothetical protein EMPG_12837 [Blastomyces silverae]